jgi:hypothetical protein
MLQLSYRTAKFAKRVELSIGMEAVVIINKPIWSMESEGSPHNHRYAL